MDFDILEIETFINSDKFKNFIAREAPSFNTTNFIYHILEDSIEVLKECEE